MGIFNSIKKSRKKSDDIDEKIEYLNKELDKNGLREGMVTSKVYVGAKEIPNALHTDFEGQGFGGKSLAYSGSDNVEIGGAKIGNVIASEVGLSPGVPSHDAILNLSGVAQSPINPNTGQRRIAYTRTGMVDMSPARPGQDQGTQGNTTGSIVWYWDANANNSNGTVGDYRQLQFFPGSDGSGYWAVWGTSFLGFTIPRPDLVPAEISGIFSNIGLTNRGNIGTPQTTVLTQNSLGDVAFLPLNTNLSRQGYDYLKDRATKRGTGFITYKQNQKQKLEPPTKSPKEIRSDKVKQLKSEGDIIGANIFYTKDRIKELEGKESLTYREESELIGLKEYSEWINTFDTPENFVSVGDEQKAFDTRASEEKQSFDDEFSNNSNQIASNIANYIENTPDLSAEEKKVLTTISNDVRSGKTFDESLKNNIEPPSDSNTSTPPPTPPTPKIPEGVGTTTTEHEFPNGTSGTKIQTNDGKVTLFKNSNGEYVEANGKTTEQNKFINDLGKAGNTLNIGTAVATNSIVTHKPSPQEIEQFITSLNGDMFENGKITVTGTELPYQDGNFKVTYDENGKRVFESNRDTNGNQGANFPDNSIDAPTNSSVSLYGKPNLQVVFPPDGSEPYVLLEKYAYENKDAHDPNSPSYDPTEVPKGLDLGSNIAHFLGNIWENTLGKIPGLNNNKIPDNIKDMNIHGMAHTKEKIPFSDSRLSEEFKNQFEGNEDYEAWNNANNDKNTAQQFPPPGQESEYTDENGGKRKYYNKGIRTSADGSKYMEILILPWVEPKAGVHDGYYGSLWHPGSYTTKIPLGGAQVRLMGAGKQVFTPKPDPKPEPPPKPEPDDRKDYEKNRDRQRRFRNSYEPKGNVLSEAAKLGHFEPEVLNVDINDIRKGIMPEFPKDPPPKMVDGYSEKSKLAPKKEEGNSDPFINITKKDLAKNHMLKDSEIKKFMDEIDLINKYIKENPSELIYVQQRYPKDDPRLAQLNWQMDQMLDAGKEYMDKTFPENEKLFKKIQKSIKKNIEFTDPKTFKDVEIPKFEGVNLTDFKRRKEIVSRHFKKAVKIERLFSNKKRRNSIREEREYLNNESENNTLKEFMSTTGMYFATRENPAIPAVMADVPDSTGVLGSGFTPPIGGNGNANDPSNYPDAYDTAWMYNSNDVDGVTNRPIVKTMDQSVIDAYNVANPENSRFPSGGAGVVFGPRGFGTGVGYASGGHYIGVLSPGLFGSGSTKIVPPGSPFGAPWFGMSGMYFPATPELAAVIMSMSGTYMSLGGYNPSGARPIQLWAPWSRFHDGDWEDQGTQKYISNTGNRWVLRTFYMYATANDYVQDPAVPVTTTVLYRDDLGNPDYLPINIDLGDMSPQGFQYLEDKAIVKKYKTEDEMWDAMSDFLQNTAGQDPAEDPFSRKGTGMDDRWIGPPVDKADASGGLGAEPGDELASAPYDERLENDAKSAYFQSGGQMAWNYLDPIQKDYWRNKVKSDTSTNIPDTSDTQTSEDPKTAWENIKDTTSKVANFLWQGAKIVTGAKAAEIIADLTLNPLVDAAFGQSVADSAGDYNTKLATSLTTSVITGKPQKIVLSDKAKKDLINSIDVDQLKKHMTIGPTPDPTANNAVNPGKGKQNGLLKGKWGNQGGTHINYDPDNGKFTITSVKMLRDFGDLDQKNAGGKITDFEDIPNPSVDQIKKIFKQKGLEKPLKKFYNTVANLGVGSFKPIAAGYNPNEAAEMMYNGLPDMSKALYNFAVEGTASNAVHLRNQLLKAGVPKSDIENMGAGFGGYVYNQETYLGSDIPGGVGTNTVGGVVVDRMKKHLGISESRKISLSEEAMLGHFEPEQLNVDIEQLRKGIMPEFPKEEPPELINGYSSKSRLAPKKLERSSFIKITKKDLAKNHMLKDSEIKRFMKRINAVNDFIKKHPEELVYAQTRYPKSDPRLAQLNWEMDQKLNASKQYMNRHYPENQRLFTKIQKSIKKNVELTDPKSFKGVKIPKFKGVNLTDFKRRKALVSRHFKKAIRKYKK